MNPKYEMKCIIRRFMLVFLGIGLLSLIVWLNILHEKSLKQNATTAENTANIIAASSPALGEMDDPRDNMVFQSRGNVTNLFINEILHTILKNPKASKLDPLFLKNFNHNGVLISDLTLNGLSHMSRKTNWSFIKHGKVHILRGCLTVNNSAIKAMWEKTVGLLKLKGNFRVNIDYFALCIRGKIYDDNFNMMTFEVSNIKGYRIEYITGLGSFGNLLRKDAYNILQQMKSKILTAIEKDVEKIFEDIIATTFKSKMKIKQKNDNRMAIITVKYI